VPDSEWPRLIDVLGREEEEWARLDTLRKAVQVGIDDVQAGRLRSFDTSAMTAGV
jgi:hypothetical protein